MILKVRQNKAIAKRMNGRNTYRPVLMSMVSGTIPGFSLLSREKFV